MLSSGEFFKLRYHTIPVKSASANISFYTNNSKCQILSCGTLVANERYTPPCEISQGSVCISCPLTFNLSIYIYSWMIVQKDQSSAHLVCKCTAVSDSICSPFTLAQRTQHTRTEVHSTVPHDNQITSAEHNTT